MEFFSDLELGPSPQTEEEIPPPARDGILGIIRARLGDDSFGLAYHKRESAGRLLDRGSAEINFRQLLETEARQLTAIGNQFMIRHTEAGKTPVATSEHVDYLFHRLFALIRLLLRASGRGG